MSFYPEGTVLTLKKPHPCGSKDWKVLRPGWEYRLQCVKCGHVVLMKRDQLLKLIKTPKAPAKPADMGEPVEPRKATTSRKAAEPGKPVPGQPATLRTPAKPAETGQESKA